jgi:hypothetical protein
MVLVLGDGSPEDDEIMVTIDLLKRALPGRDVKLPILFGPFRGGSFHSNPRSSLRKIFGLYEYEHDAWLRAILPETDLIIDVGANDGYFTFGAARAISRHRTPRVIAFEPDERHIARLRQARAEAGYDADTIQLRPFFVGLGLKKRVIALDWLPEADSELRALIKIDVDGGEMRVLGGAKKWITPRHHFMIEVHRPEYFGQIRALFAERGIALERVDQKALPLLGREQRHPDHGWLVTPAVTT